MVGGKSRKGVSFSRTMNHRGWEWAVGHIDVWAGDNILKLFAAGIMHRSGGLSAEQWTGQRGADLSNEEKGR